MQTCLWRHSTIGTHALVSDIADLNMLSNYLTLQCEDAGVYLLLKLLPQLLLGLLQLLVSELGHFSNDLTPHCNQRGILHASSMLLHIPFSFMCWKQSTQKHSSGTNHNTLCQQQMPEKQDASKIRNNVKGIAC